MKIAILILAHKNPEQLRRLVDVLKMDFEIFVHFDSRSAIAADFKDESHVHILKKRYMSSWGSHNSILAEIELLRTANNLDCDYYMLISGQDLPIVSNEAIRTFVEQNYCDYIEHHKLPIGYWNRSGGMDRLTYYWDTKKNGIVSNIITKPLFWLLRKIQKILNIKRKVAFDVYGGCNWFNLKKESVEYILSFVDHNVAFTKRFKFTRSADELFIQTVLMAFDYSKRDEIVSKHFRYFDWQTGPTYPRILTMEDYDKFINSGNLFARKFDENVDPEVIQRILEPK